MYFKHHQLPIKLAKFPNHVMYWIVLQTMYAVRTVLCALSYTK